MNFSDWTEKAVENRLKEAMETHLKLPRVNGPQEFGNGMPEIVREKWKDAAPDTTRYIKRIPPGAISRMQECWEWVNSWLEEDDRKFINRWTRLKVTKGRKIDEMSEKNPSKAKSINRTKTRICSLIASKLNRDCQPRLNDGDCGVSENQADIASTTVSSESCAPEPRHWIATGAKPQIDPDLAEMRLIDHRAIRARHSDKNRSLRAGRK